MNNTKLVVTLFALFAFFSSVKSNAAAITGEEYQAVIDTAYKYFNGAASGNQALLAQAFDMEYGDVKMINIDKETGKETVRTVAFNEFAGYFNKATKDTWTANILSVDIVDDKMAMVKLDFNTPKTHYVDYLVMYKRENGWRIINKTFTAKAK